MLRTAEPRTPNVSLTFRMQMLVLVVADAAALAAWAVFAPASWPVAMVAGAILMAARGQRGLYRARFSLSSLDEVPQCLQSGLLAVGVYALLSWAGWLGATTGLTIWLAVAPVVLSVTRSVVYALLRALRRRDLARDRLLLVGEGAVADAVAALARQDRSYGVDLVEQMPDLLHTDLPHTAAQHGCSTVLVAFSRASEAREVFEIRRGLDAGLTVLAIPRYFDLIADQRGEDVLFGMPVIRLGEHRPTIGLVVKRALDVALASLGLLLTWPAIVIGGVLVKRETGSDMLFRQVRLGQHGRPFELLKLQTMRPVPEGASDRIWSVGDDDDRLGPVGTFLRKTSLDELPQLWNILRGDMSFVGPRPERPHFAEKFARMYPHYQDRLRMPAGLTGLAQIYDLRGDTSIDDRARFDNRYEDQWSLWMDLKIILKTVPKVLAGSGG